MRVVDLGILAYRDAWDRQQDLHAEVLGGADEAILLVEHPHVITVGRRAEVGKSHILATPVELRRLNVEVVETDRGGDATYHGPGQLVAYPIVRLADHQISVGSYMKRLQKSVVDVARRFGIEARLECGFPGVWADDPKVDAGAKLCAVGVRVKKGVTLHGLALNVEPDMSKFDLIDPCGLGRPVTSMHRLLKDRCPSMAALKPMLVRRLCERITLHDADGESSCPT
ncbi:MAG: lipoyl(octanoyl) transferase LipB [Planctomycetota bacterium]